MVSGEEVGIWGIGYHGKKWVSGEVGIRGRSGYLGKKLVSGKEVIIWGSWYQGKKWVSGEVGIRGRSGYLWKLL